MRSGKIISSWQAHDGFVTKVATPEEHLLVSSSLDSSLRIWDLRRNWKSKPLASRGHTDGVSDFSIWGQNVISISRSKIGLSSLASSSDESLVQWEGCKCGVFWLDSLHVFRPCHGQSLIFELGRW